MNIWLLYLIVCLHTRIGLPLLSRPIQLLLSAASSILPALSRYACHSLWFILRCIWSRLESKRPERKSRRSSEKKRSKERNCKRSFKAYSIFKKARRSYEARILLFTPERLYSIRYMLS
jgi:hypothetical protein